MIVADRLRSTRMDPTAVEIATGRRCLHLGQYVWTGRPSSLNAERSAHWSVHRQTTETIRQQVAFTARHRGLRAVHPSAFPIVIEAFPVQKGQLADAGNCYPTVKAIIDGLADADIIPDDDPSYVDAVILQAPRRPGPGETEHVTINLWTAVDAKYDGLRP